MAFVREVISTEEDKEKYDALNLILPVMLKKEPLKAWIGLSRWVLDKDKKIIMTCLGGGAHEHPEYFVLILPEGRVEFEAYKKGKTVSPLEPNLHNNKSYVAMFQIGSIGIPPELQHRKKEILSMIEQTLIINEGVDRTDGVLAVEVNFHARYTAE